MIKVVRSELSFKTESSALAEVAPAYNRIEPQDQEDRHYALGICSYSTKEEEREEEEAVLLSAMRNVKIAVSDLHLSISALTDRFWTKFESVDNTPFEDIRELPLIPFSHPCAWRDMEQLKKVLLSQPLEGGTVVMRVGVPLEKASQKVCLSDWREGVCKCLLAGKKVNWSQGDIRLRNTLFFGRRIQLIDYNHAMKLTTKADETTPCGKRFFF
jgi:hypothetical protein